MAQPSPGPATSLNNGPPLSDNRAPGGAGILNSPARRATVGAMTRAALALILALAAGPAGAQCFADYKAKQDDPLRLHYGVAEIAGACTAPDAAQELAPRLAAAGWELLTVVGTFGPDGLEERRGNAGQYFLRF